MDNLSDFKVPSPEEYIKALDGSNKLTEKSIRSAIKELGLFNGCKVLDVPCGIGNHSLWMTEENRDIDVLGVDFAKEHLDHAKNLVDGEAGCNSLRFKQGDINNLDFKDDTFDFTWCCDGLWPGPRESGCLAKEPYDILRNMARITKSGGTIAILFCSGKKLLPGYPILESKLNATISGNRPVFQETEPDLHFMRTPLWLSKTGLTNIKSKTFVSDIQGPLEPDKKIMVNQFLNMFWGQTEPEVSCELWNQFMDITDPASKNYILNRDDYTGFITYTMFTGEV